MTDFQIREGLTLKIHPDSREPFEHFTTRSEPMIKEMDCFIKYAKGKGSFLDVGALHGIFSLVFRKLNPSGLAVAVEPSPIAFARLLYNIHANHEHISALEMALSDNSGTIGMRYQWEHLVKSDQPTEHIKCAPADSLGFFDVVKIDVEGHELNVLQGMTYTISRWKPIIFLEVHPQSMERLSLLSSFITSHGYTAEVSNGSPFDLSLLPSLTAIERIVLK